MRILEVRDNYIKFEALKEVKLSSFIKACDNLKTYIAQIIQIKQSGEYFIALAKIRFLFNGNIYDYDNSSPSNSANIEPFDFNILNKHFETKNKIIVGEFIDNNECISIDKESMNKNTLISFDNPKNCSIFTSNLRKQFKKSLVIDMIGNSDFTKLIAGVDFKLPLNTDALQFIFEDCLNDATSDSKNLIKEIFQDLANYSRTVSFVPFGTLKSIVDEMVDKQHVFKLLVLKNKLAKFAQLGYFATTKEETENLDKILASENITIDLSKLDIIFQNRYLSVILSMLENQKSKTQVFVLASNNINKQNLKKIIKGELSTVLTVQSKFKYLNDIKTMFSNFVIEPNFSNRQFFKNYSSLLSSMEENTCLLITKSFDYLPLVSSIVELNEIEQINNTKEENQIEENTLKQESEINSDSSVAEAIKSEEERANIEELESALLKNDNIEIEDSAIKDEQLDLIEKKSEKLIEKISEEIQKNETTKDIELFKNDDENLEINQEETKDINYEQDITEEDLAFEEEISIENNDDSEDINELEVEALETTLNEEIIEEPVILEKNNTDEELIIEPEIINETEKFSTQTSFENISLEEDEQIHDFQTQVDKTRIDEIETIEIPSDIMDLTIEENEVDDILETEIEKEVTSNNLEKIDNIEEETSNNDEIIAIEFEENNPEAITNSIYESNENDIDEIIEIEDSENIEADILVEMDDMSQESLIEEDIDKAIVEDVDKVFTTIKDDTISDSDLDFIDELNNEIDNNLEEITISEEFEELTELEEFESFNENEENLLEPIEEHISTFESNEIEEEKEILEKRNTSTPIVPVYEAEIPTEDMVESDSIEQGDNVTHAKYGNGIVEKMIKYGTKTLYSINFDNVGRRLLDPTLTEIKKF